MLRLLIALWGEAQAP